MIKIIIITIISNDAYISILPTSPSGSGENTFLPKKTGISPVKLLEIRMFLYYKNKARGDIFEVKGISKQFC